MKKLGIAAAVLAGSTGAAFAQASPVDQYFAAVDLATVATSVAAIGVVIVGIALASKGIGIVKSLINKA